MLMNKDSWHVLDGSVGTATFEQFLSERNVILAYGQQVVAVNSSPAVDQSRFMSTVATCSLLHIGGRDAEPLQSGRDESCLLVFHCGRAVSISHEYAETVRITVHQTEDRNAGERFSGA